MMKNLIMAFSLLNFGVAAQAADYSLKEVCDGKPEKKIQFAEKLRNKISVATSKIKEESKDAKKFEHSDMHTWLLLTYPDALPSFLFSAEARECAADQMNFLLELDKEEAAEKFKTWRSCLTEGYKDAMPDVAKRLIKCLEPKK